MQRNGGRCASISCDTWMGTHPRRQAASKHACWARPGPACEAVALQLLDCARFAGGAIAPGLRACSWFAHGRCTCQRPARLLVKQSSMEVGFARRGAKDTRDALPIAVSGGAS